MSALLLAGISLGVPHTALGEVLAREYSHEVLCGLLRAPDVTLQAMRKLMGPSQHVTARKMAFFLRDRGLATVRKVRGEKREDEYRVRLTPVGERVAKRLELVEREMVAANRGKP